MKTKHLGLCIALSALCAAACSDSNSDPNPNPDIIVPSENTDKPDPETVAKSPKVTDMSPLSGKAGATLTISGANLSKTTKVCFADKCIDPESASDAKVTAIVPEGEGMVTVAIVVDNQRLNAGTFSYLTESDAEIDWCQMTWVEPVIENGKPVQAYAQVYEAGKTGSNGTHTGIAAEFGHAVSGETNIEKFTWVTAQRNVEFNGEAAGSNDEYMASNVILPDDGKYSVAFRFSIDGVHWKYCDANGSNDGFSMDQLKTVETVAPGVTVKKIEWCRMMNEPKEFTSEVGKDSPAIYAQAFVPDCTPGDGACEGLLAQVGYGSPALSELSAIDANYVWTDASINQEYNGADSGNNHDEWMGVVKAQEKGTYAIVYRMKVDDGDWVYCDTTDDAGFTVSDGMKWIVTAPGDDPTVEPEQKKIEWCRVQAPESIDMRLNGDSPTVYGRVYVHNCTEQGIECPELKGELGYGDYNSDPSGFEYVPAEVNAKANDLGNNREFMATMKPTAAGKYHYAYRFTLDDGKTWEYCDGDDAAGYDKGHASVMTVTEDKDTIGWCRIQHPGEMAVEAGKTSESVYGQVYVEGCTDNGQACASLTAQLGYGTSKDVESFTYTDATRNESFSEGNNSEYMGQFNIATPGNYNYVYRFSVDNGQTWEYCDFDNDTGFTDDNMGKLTVIEPIAPPSKSVGWCAIVGDVPAVANYSVHHASDPSYLYSNYIYAQVYVANCTEGDQKCDDVTAQVGYGTGTDPSKFTYVDAEYNSHAQANANDEYMGKIFTKNDGRHDYAVAYRFSVDGGKTWEYCDADDATGFGGHMPIIQFRDAKVDWCRVQHPGNFSVQKDKAADVYGQIFVDGCTDEPGQCDFIQGRALYGKPSDALVNWTSFDASYNESFDESTSMNEEYVATLKASATPGDYSLIYQFSVDNGSNWTSCDYDDAVGFNMNNAAQMTITAGEAPAPATIDSCKTITTSAQADEGDSVSLSGQVQVSDGCTAKNGNGCPNLKGYVAVGPKGSNKASDYTYYPADYSKDSGNMDEYVINDLVLDPGEYNALFAFSLDNGATKTFCGTDGANSLNNGASLVVQAEDKPATPFVRGKDFTCGLPVAKVDGVKLYEDHAYYGQIWIPGCTDNGSNCDKIVGSTMHYTHAAFFGGYENWNTVTATRNEQYTGNSNNHEYMAVTSIVGADGLRKYMFSFDLKHNPNDSKEKAQRVYCYVNWAGDDSSEYGYIDVQQ